MSVLVSLGQSWSVLVSLGHLLVSLSQSRPVSRTFFPISFSCWISYKIWKFKFKGTSPPLSVHSQINQHNKVPKDGALKWTFEDYWGIIIKLKILSIKLEIDTHESTLVRFSI